MLAEVSENGHLVVGAKTLTPALSHKRLGVLREGRFCALAGEGEDAWKTR